MTQKNLDVIFRSFEDTKNEFSSLFDINCIQLSKPVLEHQIGESRTLVIEENVLKMILRVFGRDMHSYYSQDEEIRDKVCY